MGNAVKVGAPVIVKGVKEVQKQKERKEALQNELPLSVIFMLTLDICASIGFFIWALLNTINDGHLDVGLVLFPIIWLMSYCIFCCFCIVSDTMERTDRDESQIFLLCAFYIWVIPHVILVCCFLIATVYDISHGESDTNDLMAYYYVAMAILYGCFTYFGGSVLLEYRQVLTEYKQFNRYKEILIPPHPVQQQ